MACVERGVECFYDSGRLAAWADVLFLCCLPSQLNKVCAGLRSHLSKHCVVYSFTTAVPVSRYHHAHDLIYVFVFRNYKLNVSYFRLAELLGHTFIVKPQYDFVSCNTQDVWLSTTHVTTALMDPSLIEASCPLSMKGASHFIIWHYYVNWVNVGADLYLLDVGGISLSLHWVCAVFYSLLNVCTSAGLGSGETLSLINSTLQKKWPNSVQLNAQSFISSSFASSLQSHEWVIIVACVLLLHKNILWLSKTTQIYYCVLFGKGLSPGFLLLTSRPRRHHCCAFSPAANSCSSASLQHTSHSWKHL